MLFTRRNNNMLGWSTLVSGDDGDILRGNGMMTTEIGVIAVSNRPDTNIRIPQSNAKIYQSFLPHIPVHVIATYAVLRSSWAVARHGRQSGNGDSSSNKKYYYDYLVFLCCSFLYFGSCRYVAISRWKTERNKWHQENGAIIKNNQQKSNGKKTHMEMEKRIEENWANQYEFCGNDSIKGF